MIDFSKVEEMHGGDNGTERNEVSVYSAPPNLGCLNTAAQLPIMRLGGESKPTRQHYWSQMGEQNQYNAVGVNDEEAYLDSGFSRSDWNPKITVGQIFSRALRMLTSIDCSCPAKNTLEFMQCAQASPKTGLTRLPDVSRDSKFPNLTPFTLSCGPIKSTTWLVTTTANPNLFAKPFHVPDMLKKKFSPLQSRQ
ncbi:hypothetical protein L3X38_031125 [Prunus dulcis]|uniref:Uncharacterized protein n=1 Tax=Prunus dulcis TaxID=3755 RepID=A0AAD4VBW8_PRUDU|nr:hypothetical protein L3X38_031125 [Prunus dulcis]